MDYARIIDSITETIAKVAEPLTEEQRLALIGAVAVWLEKMVMEEREACAKVCDENDMSWADTVWNSAVMDCAGKIRSRSNDTGNGPRQAQLAEGPR